MTLDMTRDEWIYMIARNIAKRDYVKGKPDQTSSFDQVSIYTQSIEHGGLPLTDAERRAIVKRIEQLYTSANSGYKLF